jgi:hypothetical protein
MIASDAMMARRTVSKTEIPYAMFVYEKNSKVSIDVWLDENSVCAGESFIVNVKPTLDGANVSGRVVLKMCPQSSTNSAHITTCVLSNSVDGVYTGQMPTDSADEYDIFVTVESDSPSVFTRNASISGIAYAPIADVGGIKVNCVHYKNIDDFNEKWLRRCERFLLNSEKEIVVISCDAQIKTDEEIEALRSSIPLGLGSPEDVSAAAVYLASNEARYVTGATIDVNGGSHIH